MPRLLTFLCSPHNNHQGLLQMKTPEVKCFAQGHPTGQLVTGRGEAGAWDLTTHPAALDWSPASSPARQWGEHRSCSEPLPGDSLVKGTHAHRGRPPSNHQGVGLETRLGAGSPRRQGAFQVTFSPDVWLQALCSYGAQVVDQTHTQAQTDSSVKALFHLIERKNATSFHFSL